MEAAGPAPGTLIGGCYRVLGSLGSGGMGVVVLAIDEHLDRKVAIKLIRPELAGPGFRERFSIEARAMARVNHRNVLQIHAYGEHECVPYFVMEYVEGQSLQDFLDDAGPAPDLDLSLRILDEICQAVSAIHAADTLHRDIKPSNILLDANFTPHVADLGVCAIDRAESGEAEVVGTPAYMAPESAFPSTHEPALRPRADVYSLACVAYELLTNHLPFEVENEAQLKFLHASAAPPPPSSYRPGLPTAFDRVILRALAKLPEERTPSVDAFRRDLAAASASTAEPARVLVAEDDDDFREVLHVKLQLEFPNAEIECVADGRAALQAFDRNLPSVTILDLRMPGLDGMEVTSLLRSRSAAIAMPIIVLTASGGPDDWKRLSAIGADRFLIKPVNLDDVITLIRSTLRERTNHAASVPKIAVGADE